MVRGLIGGNTAHNRYVPQIGTGQTELVLTPPIDSIEQKVQLYFSEIGAGPEPKPEEKMVPFQREEVHNNYLLARSSYEAEGISKKLPRPRNYIDANIGNQLYETLNERLGKPLDDIFKDKKDNGEVKKTAIAILAMIALRGGVEYREFNKLDMACFSLGILRKNFDFEALDFRATNNNLHYALQGLLKGGYVAQGQTETGKPALVATSRIDSYLR